METNKYSPVNRPIRNDLFNVEETVLINAGLHTMLLTKVLKM
jgi:hypothetical protein